MMGKEVEEKKQRQISERDKKECKFLIRFEKSNDRTVKFLVLEKEENKQAGVYYTKGELK